MRYKTTQARRQVKFAIVAYCHELFLNCSVEKVYNWGNYLNPFCFEAQTITSIARRKLGWKNINNRDLFWQLQCTWREMVKKNMIQQYRPETIKAKNNEEKTEVRH